MFEAYPHAPLFLAALSLVLACFLGYMFWYNRRQKSFLKDVEREGHPSHSVDEGILLAQERSHYKHGHEEHKK